MTQLRAATFFSAAFTIFYAISVELNLALLTYHPRLGEFGLWTQPSRDGPAMHWYGWLATAALAAGLATLLALPVLKRVALPVWVGWAIPLGGMLAFVWFLRIFFLQ